MYAFDYHRPATLGDAKGLLTEGAKLLAGGQTLIPTLKQRLANPPVVIDLGAIAELRGIEQSGGALESIVNAGAGVSRERRIEDLFLVVLSRKPRPDEMKRVQDHLESEGSAADDKQTWADVYWVLLNSPAFLLNH